MRVLMVMAVLLTLVVLAIGMSRAPAQSPALRSVWHTTWIHDIRQLDARADCPDGSVPVAGGYWLSNDVGPARVMQSFPDARGWQVRVFGADGGIVRVVVVCAT